MCLQWVFQNIQSTVMLTVWAGCYSSISDTVILIFGDFNKVLLKNSARFFFFLSSGFVSAVLWRNKKRHVTSHERSFGGGNGALDGSVGWLQWLLWFSGKGTSSKPESVLRYLLTPPKWKLSLLWGHSWRTEVCCCCFLKDSANQSASTLYHLLL